MACRGSITLPSRSATGKSGSKQCSTPAKRGSRASGAPAGTWPATICSPTTKILRTTRSNTPPRWSRSPRPTMCPESAPHPSPTSGRRSVHRVRAVADRHRSRSRQPGAGYIEIVAADAVHRAAHVGAGYGARQLRDDRRHWRLIEHEVVPGVVDRASLRRISLCVHRERQLRVPVVFVARVVVDRSEIWRGPDDPAMQLTVES